MSRTCWALLLVCLCVTSCRSYNQANTTRGDTKMAITITVTSSAFKDGTPIPEQFTCDGKDISPPLAWSGVPEGAKSLALIVDDPDAPSKVWTHWVLFNLPTTVTELTAQQPKTATLPHGAQQGVNDSGSLGYSGPCPPPGPVHHYHFTLYALDSKLDLAGRVTKQQLLHAMEHHILARGTLIGTYKR